jgi:hypothetical protein
MVPRDVEGWSGIVASQLFGTKFRWDLCLLGSIVHGKLSPCPPFSFHADILRLVDYSLECMKDLMIGMEKIPRSQALVSDLHCLFPMTL